jgi:glycosyltransferase involved in cell wall biosynthesis
MKSLAIVPGRGQPIRPWLVLPTLNRFQIARYQALRGLLDGAGVIEISGTGFSSRPGWRSPTADNLEMVVRLFPDTDYDAINVQYLRKRLIHELERRRDQIDVLVVMGWDDHAALTAIYWASRRCRPVVIMSDSKRRSTSRISVREWIKRRIVALCATGLVAGTHAADYLVALGMARDRIYFGFDVVDNEYFADGVADVRRGADKIRLTHRLPRNYFLVVSRFIEEKNLSRLITAFARYRTLRKAGKVNGDSHDLWDLVLLGDGPLREQLTARSKQLKVHESIHWRGFTHYDELPVYYGLASAAILPSISETWGLVVNEAMASSLPVLVSNRCGCAPDLVRDGVNGFLFDPLDIEHLADLMLQVSACEFPLSSLGSASHEIIQYWSTDTFAENLHRAVVMAHQMSRPHPRICDRAIVYSLLRNRER